MDGSADGIRDGDDGTVRRLGLVAARIGAILTVTACVVLWHGMTICNPSFLLPFACFSSVLVGPIMTELRRNDALQGPGRMIATAVGQACGVMMLILAASLSGVNLLFWREPPLLPAPGVFFCAAALSLTAASAAAGMLALVLGRIPLQRAKWAFRFLMLAAILVYQNLPPAWPPFWYGFIADYGMVRVALGLAAFFAAIASAALILLRGTTGPTLELGRAALGD